MSSVLITGAGGGLGQALARAFWRRGHNLVLTDLDMDVLRKLAGELGDVTRIVCAAGDITDVAHQAELLARAQARFGGVGVLVNNAGITHRSPVAKTDPRVLRKVMQVDWQAPLELALAALPQLQAHRGSIVNIGSMAGWMPVLGRAGYCGAKAALAQSFEVLRCEQMQHGVHVLMAYPSFLDTPIEANALGHDGRPARHARSTMGKPKDAGWMAERIVSALEKRRRRVYSDRASVAASFLWRVAPDLYQRLMMRKFAVELRQ
ncbi:SDR family NAD(P)-dependent oxidoreductase [Aquamicrobium sp.]|uniref:SDR family NAD(P)-dependent oxidoreductase n=1 Tax=Aquamicrobium sp. TaxID=1872579 RepID=UPI0025856BEE|nr:SDR family NAD(P)-dependent oxidoreductase [Aquamicrobium sp.]MCK9550086.1 SDR family NAD(P)-dependent oxidoreductase [Aquamicrobium sp.]